MAELIQKQDTLNEGRVKINAAITDAEQAKVTADGADSKATQALSNSESTQTQLDTIVINGDSSVEAAQARVDEKGVGHTTLKDRIDDGFTKVTSQLNDIENDIRLGYLYDKIYGNLTPYSKPADFNMSIPFPIRISASGKVEYDYDVSTKKTSVSKRYYVDVVNGLNTNPGTESEPFKSLQRAFRYGDADEIILKSGVYDWTNGQGGAASSSTQKKKFNLTGQGEVYLGAHRGYLSWTDEGDGIYKTTTTNVVEVIDINNYNSPIFYEKKNSIGELSGSVGSFYVSGTDVFVRTISGNEPNDKILLNMINNALELNEFEHVYMENIKLTNTFVFANNEVEGKIYAKKCDFMFGTNKDALQINGNAYFELQNCRAMFGERDGFNYHIKNGKLPEGFELDCEGAFNGRDGADQNNGSTMHDGGKIVRIGGEYHHNHGPNVIDVNDGTQSLNIGVHAHSSTATSDVSNVDFRTRDDADMWLVNCVSHDSEYSTSVGSPARLYKDNSLLLSKRDSA